MQKQDLVQTGDEFDPNADRLREECGVFGIFGHPDAAAITALGLHALQHRGQEAAGIVSFDGKRFHSERRLGRQRRARLALAKPQPLIDRVEDPFDPFEHRSREECTVGALRSLATDVDTTLREYGAADHSHGISSLSENANTFLNLGN